MPDCIICGEELEENDPGIDNWMDDENNITRSFIVREMICNNKDCSLYKQQQDVFFDYTRIDVDGDEIEVKELKKEYKEKLTLKKL